MLFQQRQWYTCFAAHLEIFLLLFLFAFDHCAGLFFVFFLRNLSFFELRFLSVSLGRLLFFLNSTMFLRRILFFSRLHFRIFLRNFLVSLLISFLPLLLQHRCCNIAAAETTVCGSGFFPRPASLVGASADCCGCVFAAHSF